MLFQLELLTLLNLERDFDTLAYKSEKGRERKREKERKKEREREREREERKKEKEEKRRNGLATGTLLPAAF